MCELKLRLVACLLGHLEQSVSLLFSSHFFSLFFWLQRERENSAFFSNSLPFAFPPLCLNNDGVVEMVVGLVLKLHAHSLQLSPLPVQIHHQLLSFHFASPFLFSCSSWGAAAAAGAVVVVGCWFCTFGLFAFAFLLGIGRPALKLNPNLPLSTSASQHPATLVIRWLVFVLDLLHRLGGFLLFLGFVL